MNALRASERAKNDFLASLSHELRTPLNVILGYSRMLSSKATDDCQRYAVIIERNAKAQLTLVEDLLDMQRIVSGRFTIEHTQFDLSSLSRAVMDSLRPQAEAKGLHFLLRSRQWRCWEILARIQQVVWNLLSNAIKFTPKDGCIGLHAIRRDDNVIIHVQDSGRGSRRTSCRTSSTGFGNWIRASRDATTAWDWVWPLSKRSSNYTAER